MTSIQIKREIKEVLDKLPKEALKNILDYLKVIEKLNYGGLNKIITEDKELLKKLAE